MKRTNSAIRITILGVIAWMMTISSLPAQSEDEKAMSLQECLQYARSNSTSINNAILQQKIADSEVGVTRAAGLPQINGNVRLTDNYEVQKAFIPSEFFPSSPEQRQGGGQTGANGSGQTSGNGGNTGNSDDTRAVQMSSQFQGSASVELTQMIFNPSYFVGLEAAKTFRELRKDEAEQARRQVVEGVTKAYYAVLVNKKRIDLARQNFMRLDTLLYETKAMHENGFAESIEVDRVKVNHNNAKTNLNRSQRLLENSKKMLKFQMGMDVNTPLELTDNLKDVNFNYPENPKQNFSYEQRIEYQQVQTNHELTRLDKKNNTMSYLPSINAFANYGYNTGTNNFDEYFDFGDRWKSYGALGVTLNIPIFDGLEKSHKIQKNKLEMQQVENQRRNLKNQIDQEIHEAYTQLQNSVEEMRNQEENMKVAKRVYETAKTKYEEGVGSNREVVDAEVSYKEAETNYYNALYEALIAKVNYEKALGILLNE